jgi:hypothetical protein
VSVVTDQYIGFTSADVGAAAVAGDGEVVLSFGTTLAGFSVPAALRRRKVVLWRVDFKRKTGGSATNYTPALADASGASSSDWSVKYLGSATAPGTRFSVTDIEMPMFTDNGTTNKLYLKLNGDAADTFDYEVWFRATK